MENAPLLLAWVSLTEEEKIDVGMDIYIMAWKEQFCASVPKAPILRLNELSRPCRHQCKHLMQLLGRERANLKTSHLI